MEGRKSVRLYRIGEFARKLGVTPDFLKYCEKNGLITTCPGENGTRCYDFTQASRILEYIKLRNQGYSAQEIVAMTTETPFAESLEELREKDEELRVQALYLEHLQRHHKLMYEQKDYYRTSRWLLGEYGGFFFLPHTRGHDFLKDSAVPNLVSRWTPYMPVVMSACQEAVGENGSLPRKSEDGVWGLMVEEDFARGAGLPVEKPVIYVPPGIYLEAFCLFSLEKEASGQMDPMEQINHLLKRNQLKPRGDAYMQILAKLVENGKRVCYSRVFVPVYCTGDGSLCS